MSENAKETLFLIGVYVAMVAGMVAKTLFDHFTGGSGWAWRRVIIPMLVSPLIYGTVFKIVRGSSETVLMLIFGFQNGFFWQDVFGRITSEVKN